MTLAILAYDPTITLGNLLMIMTIVCGLAMFLIRNSYSAGKYSQEFKQVHQDLNDIKATLKEQDREYREKQRADSLADGLQLVLQQRVATLEGEMGRARENIHNLANALQVEVAKRVG
jgi:hypothetical protein